jgi:tetratricopeptide (TPR) repeat protein
MAVFTLADYMRTKPFVEKLGYIPSVKSVKVMAADHKQFVSASLMLKVLIYFGSLVDKADNQMQIPADYPAMSRTIDAALKLDPYNMDGYYFAQAILAWDVGKADLANGFMENGMKYRTWDWQLPYFAGFNYAYFLKDYANAARLYRRAAELSGNEMFMNLAGRYMQRSGNTEMAIAYLSMMMKNARHDALKKSLVVRRAAFLEVLKIEKARDAFFQRHGRFPVSLDDLVHGGFLYKIPKDPYGGKFIIQNNGSISSTSGFAFAAKK